MTYFVAGSVLQDCSLVKHGLDVTKHLRHPQLGSQGDMAGVGRRNESRRHKWLLLGARNGHFVISTLQIFCFCRHMWRPLAHLCVG